MNLKELNQFINLISDCDNYLMGKQHSRNLADIAEAAAHRGQRDVLQGSEVCALYRSPLDRAGGATDMHLSDLIVFIVAVMIIVAMLIEIRWPI